jgi:aryl-alcohol dehydrogenase-like predicted oxidoreductase
VLDDERVLEELAVLRREGLRVGLTSSGARQCEMLERALEIRVDGEPLFDCVQATWNLLEPSAGPVLARAHAAGVGVIVKEALANGRLTPRNREHEFAARGERLATAARRHGVGWDGVALAAALAQPWADVVLSGVVRVDHLTSNLQALAVVDGAALARELADFAEPPDVYWSTRSRLPWN